MGAGVSFMENQPDLFTRGLTTDEYEEAMRELGEPSDLTEASDYRSAFGDFDFEFEAEAPVYCDVPTGSPRTYGAKERMTNVQAFGAALADIWELNRQADSPLVVFDCAHANTLALGAFAQKNHDKFMQCGLGNHAAVSVASAMSGEGIAAVLVDYGVYALQEVYNQLRLADINRSNLKIVAAQLGVDAGSDGKATHCVDYMGLAANLFGFRLILPADANQTDRAFRYMISQPGNWILGLGKTETPIITGQKGSSPIFGGDYEFEYGGITEVRHGDNGVIITTGQMLPKAIEAWAILNREGMAPTLLHVSSPLALDDNEDPALVKWLRKGRVITYEDHNVFTGLGARVANVIARKGISSRLLTLGITRYALSGDAEDLYRWMGLDVEKFVTQARKFLKR
jgi:transketolase